MKTARNAVTIAAPTCTLIGTLLSHGHDDLSLFFLDGFFVIFLHALCLYTYVFYFLQCLLAHVFSLGRMHLSHGVSSPSSNQPLIYGDFIYRSLPHKALRYWVSK